MKSKKVELKVEKTSTSNSPRYLIILQDSHRERKKTMLTVFDHETNNYWRQAAGEIAYHDDLLGQFSIQDIRVILASAHDDAERIA